MEPSAIIALCVAALNLVVLVGTLVWGVARIRSTTMNATNELRITLGNTNSALNTLDATMQRVVRQLHNHETRLTVIEKIDEREQRRKRVEAARDPEPRDSRDPNRSALDS